MSEFAENVKSHRCLSPHPDDGCVMHARMLQVVMSAAERLAVGRVERASSTPAGHDLVHVERETVCVAAAVHPHHAAAVAFEDLVPHRCSLTVLDAALLAARAERCASDERLPGPQRTTAAYHATAC